MGSLGDIGKGGDLSSEVPAVRSSGWGSEPLGVELNRSASGVLMMGRDPQMLNFMSSVSTMLESSPQVIIWCVCGEVCGEG